MAEIEITGKQIGQLDEVAEIAGSEKIPVETADGNGHVTTEQIKEYAQPDLSGYATKAEIPSTEGLLTETEADGKYATKAEIDGIGGVGKPGEGKDAEIFNDYTNNQATGEGSHAEGLATTASSLCSHAEGSASKASGNTSHAEGLRTTASGATAHTEGCDTIAAGDYSHAEGNNTQAQNDVEHAEGSYNKSNATTRHSVGIGTSDDDRKNAFEIMANGDIYVYGLGGYDGTNALSSGSKTLQTVLAELQSAQAELQQAQKYAVRAVKVEIPFSDGVATYTPAVALDFSVARSLAAYAATAAADGQISLAKVDTVAAGEGVLLRSLSGGAASEYVPLAGSDVSPTEGNLFVGTLTDIAALPTEADGVVNYILNSGEQGLGFYRANNQEVAAGKAYLRVPSDGAPDSVTLPKGEAVVKTIPESGYVSFSHNKAVEVPADVTVYKAKFSTDGGSIELTAVDTDVIPADTGVLLYSATPGDKTLYVTDKTTEADFTDNGLIATSVAANATVPTEGKYYSLRAGAAEFAAINGGVALSANKAYIKAPDTASGNVSVTLPQE